MTINSNKMQSNNYQGYQAKSKMILHTSSIEEISDVIMERLVNYLSEFLSKQIIGLSNRTLNVEEVCEMLDISRQTLSNWVRDGKIVCHKIGGRCYYLENEINETLHKVKKYK